MVAITTQAMADEIRRQQLLAQSISTDQAAVSSGKRITLSSQDPQAWVQISDIGRAQAQNASWSDNISYAEGRSQKAEGNLGELNTLFSRARALMVSASTSTMDAAGKAAVLAELSGIRASVSDLLNEKDYQGVPVFDDTNPTMVPVSRGLTLEAVGTRQSIESGITVNSTPRTLDDILLEAYNAVSSGTQVALDASLTSTEAGLDHVILQQSIQGIRSDRLDTAKSQNTSIRLDLKERRSGLEDTDLTETIARIQAKLLSLEAAQAAFARINRQSLFDLIS
ncbi:MAG: flagellin [Sphingobium sp.]|jgi:flagellar hook-associated protein 3 FlgL|nr:flagellin [Sphingobium sp.]MCI1270145.1 flagellin [Sphingobium sp.]MCI1754928.1 flagellin [Sphingobium sp.]MCI2051673.1 flagellin [Sphingobium sp.]